jgi:two-component system, OmpR family, response regulator
MPYPLSPAAYVGPHVLVADDDATSRCFLGEALRQLGASVTLSEDGRTALTQARTQAFDLLVLDCRMPDIHAVDVLKQLRADMDACSVHTPAVASSAEMDAMQRRTLLDSGFHAVLLKPCTLHDLQHVLALAVPAVPDGLALLDDPLALKTSGTPAVMHALRKLFRQELLHVYEQLEELSLDNSAFEARLHKLRSSCGFCGAVSLAEHILALQRQLKLADQRNIPSLDGFRQALLQTIRALGLQ